MIPLLVQALVLNLGQDQIVAPDSAVRAAYEEACAAGATLACGQEGFQNAAAAAEALLPACNDGDPVACMVVAWALTQVKGEPSAVAPNPEKGALLLNQACEGGVSRACADLGTLLVRGIGTDLDADRGVALLEGACEAGELVACRRLGALYHAGQVVGRDLDRATSLYGRACEGGHPSGCNSLGLLAQLGMGTDDPEPRVGEALGHYEGACAAGYVPSCSNLVQLYASPRYGIQDDARVAEYTARGCELKDGGACFSLGVMRETGHGVPADVVAAAQAYELACELGEINGCAARGALALAGAPGLAKDPAEAARRFRQACDHGQATACAVLAQQIDQGDGLPADPAQATELFARACDGEVAEACAILARRHQKGRGTAKDKDLARQLWFRACSLGHDKACKRAK